MSQIYVSTLEWNIVVEKRNDMLHLIWALIRSIDEISSQANKKEIEKKRKSKSPE